MQFKHPESGTVAMQMTLPTPDGCSGLLALYRSNKEIKEFAKFISCNSTSVSSSLPARATVRNKLYAFLVEVEALTAGECNSATQSMMEGDGGENLEIVAACAVK